MTNPKLDALKTTILHFCDWAISRKIVGFYRFKLGSEILEQDPLNWIAIFVLLKETHFR